MPQLQIVNRPPSFQEMLGENLGTGISQGISSMLSQHLQQKKTERAEQNFISRGYPEDLAKLAASATTGGQTEVLKSLLEMRQRQLGPSFSQEREPFIEERQEDLGLTPKEKITREEGRFKTQLPKYNELAARSSGLEQEETRLNRLEELNKSGKLPKGLSRLNVDFNAGELRAPFLASPESQEFVKIINDFLSGAKDTFGARVTNFEVSRFMRRLPSLLNTEEGRESVLKQMSTLNKINKLYNDTVLDEIDKRGGVRKIDLDKAERIAKSKTKDEINRLKKEYINSEKQKVEKEEYVLMRDPSGLLRRVPKKDVLKAQKSGYKIER